MAYAHGYKDYACGVRLRLRFVRTCKQCGERFRTYSATVKTCSRPCSNAFSAAQRVTFRDTIKSCAICGLTFERHEREIPASFKRRKTCSDACKNKLIGRRNRKARREPKPKKCVICGSLFQLRPQEQLGAFKLKMTCGKPCQYSLLSKSKTTLSDAPKTCVSCGREFGRQPTEKRVDYSVRRGCGDKDCPGRPPKYQPGKEFGDLTITGPPVLKDAWRSANGKPHRETAWPCRCDHPDGCGREVVVSQRGLANGDATSCGAHARKKYDAFGDMLSIDELTDMAGCLRRTMVGRLSRGIDPERAVLMGDPKDVELQAYLRPKGLGAGGKVHGRKKRREKAA